MNQEHKSIILHPSRKAFLWEYFFGILLIPILLGIFLLWKTYRKQKSTSYRITNHSITANDQNYSETIDLVNIKHVQLQNERFNTGNLVLKTKSRKMTLVGMENPEKLKEIIEKAISSELQRLESEASFTPREPEFEAGEMERMDYLTGLWQQGLLSNEEFRKELKN